MAQLINTANVFGNYQGFDITDTTQAIVELSAVTIEKTADKRIWVDGELEYTITVTNIDESEPGEPVLNVRVTDHIDDTIALFVNGSLTMTINTVPVQDPQYTIDADGNLTVTVGELQSGDVAVISFRVEMPQ